MFELVNIGDGSVVATVKDYDMVDDALRVERRRLRATVGKFETTAHENVDLFIDGVRTIRYRITSRTIERLM